MICGLLGEKLSHSFSPQIHSHLGDYNYTLFEKNADELDDFFKNESFHGINVTIPYKKTVIPYCHKLTPQAQKIGAVNTVVRSGDGTLIGHNTDYFGFRSMASRLGITYQDKKVLVLGSGGASNTVCAVMEELGAKVVVISRNGENNYKNISKYTDCAVIVNTTPVGMYPNTGVSPVNLKLFPKLEGVMDLIYNPFRTRLLLDAEQMGIPAENGLWMLIAQAWESAQWFLGRGIPEERISAIYHILKNQIENIILVGMPGSGKSTVGKLLAEKLNKSFVDTDTQIEILTGRKIPEIFQTDQEDGFRKLESKVIAEFGMKNGQVIATGGGCVTKEENYALLRQNGTIFWIQRDISALSTDGRPLSQSNDLYQMYASRKQMYERFADFSVSNSSTPIQTVHMILQKLEERI